jgi:hypothetical protein
MNYLYVKTHNKTGLKYLGYTAKKDPYIYSGSGKRWLRHLKTHGFDFKTEILLATQDLTQIKETGIFFSKLWNIVESTEWANLMEESGTGGSNSKNIDYKKLVETRKRNGKTWTQSGESNLKRSIAQTGKTKSEESIRKTVESKKRNGTNKHTEETKIKLSESSKGKPKPLSETHYLSIKSRLKDFNSKQVCCPHCGKEGQHTNMKRWHFDHCRSIPQTFKKFPE